MYSQCWNHRRQWLKLGDRHCIWVSCEQRKDLITTYEEKFPVKSMAPPMVESLLNEIPSKAELLAIWNAPPTDVRPGMVMLARLGLATMAKLPVLPPKLPTVVKLGALSEEK